MSAKNASRNERHMTGDVRSINAGLWDVMYRDGLVIAYPNDVFVRVAHRLFDVRTHPTILDYGFGSGQNTAHLLTRGFQVHGVEVSGAAVRAATDLLSRHGLTAELRVTTDGVLPYADSAFDGAIAWGVLEYNDWHGLGAAVREIDRVLRPGGLFLGAINAPGDFKHEHATPLGDGLFALDAATGGQQGARVLIMDREDLPRCFPGRSLTVGHYEHSFGPTYARHWIVSYAKDGAG